MAGCQMSQSCVHSQDSPPSPSNGLLGYWERKLVEFVLVIMLIYSRNILVITELELRFPTV